MSLKNVFETAVAKERFNINDINDLYDHLTPDSLRTTFENTMHKINNITKFNKILKGIIRFAFLIELVKDDVTSTKFEVRWSTRLQNDVRYASFEDCLAIFESLLNKILHLNNDQLQIIELFLKNPLLPYELPIDYIVRKTEHPIHTVNNIDLFTTEEIKNCVKLREIIKNNEINPDSDIFTNILRDKIQVKTYLTDRALTGAHKTNREKRWETHPASVQFALRRDCLKIEKTLMLQVCKFRGAPHQLKNELIKQNILTNDDEYFRCPITGDVIDYNDFKQDVISPIHGKSRFQVGHLNPLKSNGDNEIFGHTARNISWISEDGNRIQGSLSMHEVDALLLRIFKNRNFKDQL
ncbi:hypothetical protein TSYNTROOL_23510 [Tepidanaerobacter syntrophicus]|jgi:hypothetical protein|uniref:hypothetical protein n=1 Tax=Tepidanaerobacter syntrophicus TaxID=224999 RepID=UPI0022EF2DC6|nr:hypothetical protein [Tepidanaerobacter syntrophicus]GLI52265.1 hypothetical protein TSYNTROOL_23510 [Tepidanaerobacter syntrophicus]